MSGLIEWAKRIWRDPVWSKVIAAAILAACISTWAFVKGSSNEGNKESQLAVVSPSAGVLDPKGETQGKKIPPQPSTKQSKAPETSKEYFDKYNQLNDEGRFLERDEYVRGLDGVKLLWNGYVRNIVRNGPYILLILDVNTSKGDELVGVNFTPAMESKLFSLRKGDHVVVTGRLQGSSSASVVVNGDTFERVSDAQTEVR